MSGISLSARDLVVRRDQREVLRVPALEIPAGSSLAIVGPNGAGKSTLAAALAGLAVPSAGAALVGGAPATSLTSRRRVALLPQDAPMLAGSVLDNVALPLALRRVPEARALAAARLAAHGLSALGPRPAQQLSGGEARRVALARALAATPDALLLDEPFSGVDAPAREALLADIRAQVTRAGITLVVVTQVRDEALRLASRLAVILDGRLAQDGTPEDVCFRPASPQVARFLDAGNVLHGRVSADGLFEIGGARIHSANRIPPGDAWLVLSPDHVELRLASDHPAGSARNVLAARVVSLDPREGRVQISLDAGFPLVAAVTRAAVDELGLAPGTAVQAVFKAMACHLVAGSAQS